MVVRILLLALLGASLLEISLVEGSTAVVAATSGATGASTAAASQSTAASGSSGTTPAASTTSGSQTSAQAAQTTALTASQAEDATAKWFCKPPSAIRPSQVIGSFFCENYTNYWVACNLGDQTSCSDAYVRYAYAELENLLSLYSCDAYSRIFDCDDCLLAYQRWICSYSFKQCNDSSEVCGGVGNPPDPDILPQCVRKTCQDVCYDVMRKCPPEIAFICPPQNDQREYFPPGTVCNNLELPPPNFGLSNYDSGSVLLRYMAVSFVLFILSVGAAL